MSALEDLSGKQAPQLTRAWQVAQTLATTGWRQSELAAMTRYSESQISELVKIAAAMPQELVEDAARMADVSTDTVRQTSRQDLRRLCKIESGSDRLASLIDLAATKERKAAWEPPPATLPNEIDPGNSETPIDLDHLHDLRAVELLRLIGRLLCLVVRRCARAVRDLSARHWRTRRGDEPSP